MTNDNTRARRWTEFQAELLRLEECATKADLVSRWGEDVSRWLNEGAIFSVIYGDDDYFPCFQFADDAPIPIIRQILAVMRPKASDWEIFGWFMQSNSWSCRGQKPKDLLLVDPAAVVEAARHEVAEQWF